MKKNVMALLLASLLLLSACGQRSQPEAASSAAQASSASSQPASSASSQPASSGEEPPASSEQEASAPASSAEAPSSSEASETASSGGGAVSASASVSETALPESARAEDSYFDDAVFIGDSVSLKLNLYTTQHRKEEPGLLGTAQFLTAGSMGSGNALQPVSDSSIHPLYNGEKLSLADAVAKSGAKKVYIMLGMNDLAVYGVDGAAANMETLLQGILEKTPDAEIFIQTATPLTKAKNIETNKLNNSNLRLYNDKLAELCQKNGWYLVDVCSAVQDGEGNLNAAYCSDPDDMGIHFTDEGCRIWIDYLYTHTPQA